MAQLRDFDGRLSFAAAGIQHPQRSRPQLRQQRFQILPEDRLTQLAFCGAVNIARKLSAMSSKLRSCTSDSQANTKPLFCHTRAENEAICYKIRT